MREVTLFFCFAGLGLALTACSGDKDGAVSFDDTGSGSDGGSDDGFDSTDSEISASIDGDGWGVSLDEEGAIGYFTTSNIYASTPSSGGTAQTFSIAIDGDLKVPGTYAITFISYTLQVAQDTPTVYEVENPPDFFLTVLGFAEEGYEDSKYMFAESSGTASLEGGVEVEEIEIEAWPKF
jgi:hypothetical protein